MCLRRNHTRRPGHARRGRWNVSQRRGERRETAKSADRALSLEDHGGRSSSTSLMTCTTAPSDGVALHSITALTLPRGAGMRAANYPSSLHGRPQPRQSGLMTAPFSPSSGKTGGSTGRPRHAHREGHALSNSRGRGEILGRVRRRRLFLGRLVPSEHVLIKPRSPRQAPP